MFNKRLGDQMIGAPAARVDPPALVRGNVSPARSPRAIVDLIGAIDTGFIDAIAEHRHPVLLRQRWHRSPVMRMQVQDGMTKVGIVPGKPFDLSALDPANQAAPKDIPKSGTAKIIAKRETLGTKVTGWQIPGAAGRLTAYHANVLGERDCVVDFGTGQWHLGVTAGRSRCRAGAVTRAPANTESP